MPAPTNISFLTATDLGTITTTPTTVTQTADFGGTTYPLYFSFLADTGTVEYGAFGFGDLTTYFVRTTIYVGPAASPTQVIPSSSAITAINRPVQFPVTPGETYFVVCAQTAGNPSPATLTLQVTLAPSAAVPIGSLAINDDTAVEFPLAFLSGTADYTALKYIAPFPFGEAGDTLIDGTVLVENSGTGLELFNSAYQTIATQALTGAALRIRTCLGANRFYVGINTNPSKFYTMSPTGTFSTATVLTAMTSMAALAASNDEVTLYHAFTGTNQAIRQWTIGVGAGANLVAGIANYVVVDILVLGDDSIVVGYYKSTVTRDYLVKRYDDAGVTLNTYTFAIPNPAAAPRLAYAIDDPISFWVMLNPASDVGAKEFFNIKVSDGSVLTTRTHAIFEAGAYAGAQSATPPALFGCSISCPFWIVRSASLPTTQTFPIRRQRRFLLPSSDDNKRMSIPIIELLMQAGIGLKPDTWGEGVETPLGADPQVMIRISKDGGKTWSNERWLSAGQRGQFTRRVRLVRATGMYRNAVLEVTVDAPCDFQFLAALGDPIEGSS